MFLLTPVIELFFIFKYKMPLSTYVNKLDTLYVTGIIPTDVSN